MDFILRIIMWLRVALMRFHHIDFNKLMTTVTLIPVWLLLQRFLSLWLKNVQLEGRIVHASLPDACKNLTVKVNILCFVILAVLFLLILERDKSICNKPFSHTLRDQIPYDISSKRPCASLQECTHNVRICDDGFGLH